MEDTLREKYYREFDEEWCSLNPCFNGRYSQSVSSLVIHLRLSSLNPCFNGRYSQRKNTATR